MGIEPETTIAELVLERPARARLFERLGLDYCCGGKRSLEEACARRGLDTATVIAVLEAGADEAGGAEERDWRSVPLAELCDHVVSTHHAFLRTELPRLAGLAAKVERAHAADRPELAEVRRVVDALRAELEEHIADEEATLFPACRELERTGDPGALAGLDLPELEREHESAGAALERLRELTGGYDAGGALCNTHRALVDALRELELDVHQHVHEENNVLFPRALAAAGGPSAA